MKKLSVMLVLVFVLMTLCWGQAETRLIGYHHDRLDGLSGRIYEEHYFVTLELDYSGETVEVEVDKDTFESIVNDHKNERNHHDNLWYVKAWQGVTNFAIEAADWVTFWK